MQRILFVDDEQNVLDGLRRSLRAMRNEWNVEFACGGSYALAALAAGSFDAVVTDMRMPEMDGLALLVEILARYPSTVRIVLSGYSDKEMEVRVGGLVHSYLAKPCPLTTLADTLKELLREKRTHADAHAAPPSIAPALLTEADPEVSAG